MNRDPIEPPDPQTTTLQSVEEVLGISSERHIKITWIIEDICDRYETKADAIHALAEVDATEEERVYMGFLLCKKYVSTLPGPVRILAMRAIQ